MVQAGCGRRYAGSALACAAANATLDVLPGLLPNVRARGAQLRAALTAIAAARTEGDALDARRAGEARGAAAVADEVQARKNTGSCARSTGSRTQGLWTMMQQQALRKCEGRWLHE